MEAATFGHLGQKWVNLIWFNICTVAYMLKLLSYSKVVVFTFSSFVKQTDHASRQPYSTQAGRNGFSNGEPPLSLGYGPAFDAPREGSPVLPSPKAGVNKSISDVLRALQMAKANIQNGGAGSKDPRLLAPTSCIEVKLVLVLMHDIHSLLPYSN